MPIHLIWGDDDASCERAIKSLIEEIIHPNWMSINLSRFEGQDILQAKQALEEAQTPPFGEGGRLVILRKSPLCNGCSNELSSKFESISKQIPLNTYLVLNNLNKPDKRLKTTKLIHELIKSKKAVEQSFALPTAWNIGGQKELVKTIAASLNLEIEARAIDQLVESIGNDSGRMLSELKKLALLEDSKVNTNIKSLKRIVITSKSVQELVIGSATNALEIGNFLLAGNFDKAVSRTDTLLDKGEPALRIIATLTGQIRGLLWVSLLENEKQHDVNFIANQAGIANPKRIYVMRKQINGKSSTFFIDLLKKILEIESSIKKGINPKNAFRDQFL